MTDKVFFDEIMEMRHKRDMALPNHFGNSIERLCEKQEKNLEDMNKKIAELYKERNKEIKKELNKYKKFYKIMKKTENEKAIDVLRRVKNEFKKWFYDVCVVDGYMDYYNWECYNDFVEILDQLIKEYGGKNEKGN